MKLLQNSNDLDEHTSFSDGTFCV